jgi:hypothetical protein
MGNCNQHGAPSAISLDSACGTDCAPNAPPRTYPVVDRIPAATRAVNGQEVQVDMQTQDCVDAMGRHAHVIGFMLQGVYNITTGAANDACDEREVKALFRDIRLKDASGWEYMSGLDGRSIRDDQFLRTYMLDEEGETDEGIATNLGAGQHGISVSCVMHLIRNTRPGEVQDYQGAIPLRALQKIKGALSFRPGSTVLDTGGAELAATTFDGFTGTITATLALAWLPKEILPRQWNIDNYEFDELSGSLRHAERITEYAAVRHMGDDSGGETISDYDGISVQVNGIKIADNLSLAEHCRRDAWIIRGFHPVANGGGGAGGLGASSSGSFPLYASAALAIQPSVAKALLLVPQERYPEQMASGRIGFRFSSRTRTRTRVLHRTIACQDAGRAAKVFGSNGCARPQVLGLTSGGEVVKARGDRTLVNWNPQGS